MALGRDLEGLDVVIFRQSQCHLLDFLYILIHPDGTGKIAVAENILEFFFDAWIILLVDLDKQAVIQGVVSQSLMVL